MWLYKQTGCQAVPVLLGGGGAVAGGRLWCNTCVAEEWVLQVQRVV